MAKLSINENTKVETPDGKGCYYRQRIAEGVENLGPKVKTYAKITVPAGTAMAYHKHEGDFEIYYIVEGEGLYNDNGTEYPVKVGDVVRCADGECHGISNTGSGDLAFIALIVATD